MNLRSTLFLLFCPIVGSLFPNLTSYGDAVDDPTVAAKDEDFLIQGEYVGEDVGVQVIALGDGQFQTVIYEGGLPGAGSRPGEPHPAEPRRVDGDAKVVKDLIESMRLDRIERASETLGAKPPPSAIVLFDGTQESVDRNWQDGRLTEDGFLDVGTETKQHFRDYRLHLEFRTPWMPNDEGQKRGNSGVYHQGRYETQILDSFGLKGLNNQAGGIYTVSDPSVNAAFPPLVWQTYDVDFTAARFNAEGDKVADAVISVKLNGIVVQTDVKVPGITRAAPRKEDASDGPIFLQDHNDPVRFRNIWILPTGTVR